MATRSKLMKSALAFCGSALLLAGCASSDEMRALRQPSMPPVAVAKASRSKPFYRNIAIQEVQGAPEFRWFDGGDILTTRPTRTQVLDQLTGYLDRADMLAPRLDAEYMLYVQFHELAGPNVWLGSDKLASAHITFRLVRWRTNELVVEKTIESSYRVQWVGITPDMVRSGLAGPLGVARDSADAKVGGLIGGMLLSYYLEDNLSWPLAVAPVAAVLGGISAAEVGGPQRFGPGYDAAFVTAVGLAAARGRFNDLETTLAYGAIMGAGAAAGPEPVTRSVGSGEVISGEFSGTARRFAATRGLIDLAFDRFMNELSRDGSVVYKRAVSCRALNPDGYRGAHLVETADAYAIDCPGASYNNSPTTRTYPTRF